MNYTYLSMTGIITLATESVKCEHWQSRLVTHWNIFLTDGSCDVMATSCDDEELWEGDVGLRTLWVRNKMGSV